MCERDEVCAYMCEREVCTNMREREREKRCVPMCERDEVCAYV